MSRYRARLEIQAAITRQCEQAQLRSTAAEEHPGLQSLLPLTLQNNEAAAEAEGGLSLPVHRMAEIECTLSRETDPRGPRLHHHRERQQPNDSRLKVERFVNC